MENLLITHLVLTIALATMMLVPTILELIPVKVRK